MVNAHMEGGYIFWTKVRIHIPRFVNFAQFGRVNSKTSPFSPRCGQEARAAALFSYAIRRTGDMYLARRYGRDSGPPGGASPLGSSGTWWVLLRCVGLLGESNIAHFGTLFICNYCLATQYRFVLANDCMADVEDVPS